ncbi:SWIM zinc finger family protein, partial [Streptomyces sp. NPDC006984]|uniref:SWIM zinc finger family protein n=1 Tax=Streptomyces sp. NPDC006984 TaxID=3155463 RepID=UPI0034074EF2
MTSSSTTPTAADQGDRVPLPPVAPEVVAAAVEGLTSRLRKKLDAAIERCAAAPVAVEDGILRIDCGADAEVTLHPGASGTVGAPEQARCTCLLAPRCLHRAAVLGACPVADPGAGAPDHRSADPQPAGAGEGAGAPDGGSGAPDAATAQDRVHPSAAPAPTSAQRSAAAGLWGAAAA